MTDEQILQLAEQHFDYQGGWIAYSKDLKMVLIMVRLCLPAHF